MNSLDNKDQTSNPTLDNELENNISIKLQKLLSKYDINDRDFVAMLQLIDQEVNNIINQRELAIAKHFAFHFGISEEEVIKVLGDMK
jgi:hypothetical protein